MPASDARSGEVRDLWVKIYFRLQKGTRTTGQTKVSKHRIMNCSLFPQDLTRQLFIAGKIDGVLKNDMHFFQMKNRHSPSYGRILEKNNDKTKSPS